MHTKMAYDGVNRINYYLIRVGAYSKHLGSFNFSKQLKMAEKRLISIKKPHFSDQHRMLRDYIRALLSEEITAVLEAAKLGSWPVVKAPQSASEIRMQEEHAMCSPGLGATVDASTQEVDSEAEARQPQALFASGCGIQEDASGAPGQFSTPEDMVKGLLVETPTETRPQALFDTPTQEAVGAMHILESIEMQQFPVLSRLGIRLSTDFYLRALQREFDNLGEIIESVDLANVVARNDKVRTRITVPKTGSWKSFCLMMKRTKWLFKAVDSVLPTANGDEELDKLEQVDDDKVLNCSDVIEWFICILGEEDPDAFLRAVKKLGVPVATKKLSPEELTEMAGEGNFGCATERVIRQFLLNKGINILPSDRKMRMLGDHAIIPTTKKVKLGGLEYVVLHCPLEKVVSAELSMVTDKHLKWCDIIIGGIMDRVLFNFLQNSYTNTTIIHLWKLKSGLGRLYVTKKSTNSFN